MKTENYLALDTSGESSCCTIFVAGKFYSHSLGGQNSHNEEIDSLVRETLGLAKLSPDQISAVLIGAGPGSFTGLRIGFAYAKGLALALNKPLISYSSLEALAYDQSTESGKLNLIVCSDARRDQFFVSHHLIDSSGVKSLMPISILDKDQLYSRLKEVVGELRVVSLSPAQFWPFAEFATLNKANLSRAIVQMHLSNAGQKDAVNKARLLNLADLEPLYLRDVAAKTLQERGVRQPRH